MVFNEQFTQEDIIKIQDSQAPKALKDFPFIKEEPFFINHFGDAKISPEQGKFLKQLLQDPNQKNDILSFLQTSHQPDHKHFGEFLDGLKKEIHGVETEKNKAITNALERPNKLPESSVTNDNTSYQYKYEQAHVAVTNTLDTYTAMEIPTFLPKKENSGVTYIGSNGNYTDLLKYAQHANKAHLANNPEKTMTT